MLCALESIWMQRQSPGLGRYSMYGYEVPIISKVSHSSRTSSEGAVPGSPIPPVV